MNYKTKCPDCDIPARDEEQLLKHRQLAHKVFVTKDSGVREEFESGMVRDTQDGKARFDLLFPKDVPFDEQMITRAAALMERGVAKYGERNWELANSNDERNRAIASALRHMVQWVAGETDEDHAAAVIFNLIQAETVAYKLTGRVEPVEEEPEVFPEDYDWTGHGETPVSSGTMNKDTPIRCGAFCNVNFEVHESCDRELFHSGWHRHPPAGDHEAVDSGDFYYWD